MKVILKYPLNELHTELMLPRGARFLSLQVQRNVACMWALVEDTEVRDEKWVVEMVGTGWDADYVSTMEYLATVQIEDFVWHAFVRKEV